MSEPDHNPPIIVVRKKKGGHGGHHGGAWKVAYADFVTAMMALFIVLWLMNSSEEVQQAVAGYFRDPKGYGKQAGSGKAGSGEAMAVGRADMQELKHKIEGAMGRLPEFQRIKDQVQMVITGEGLRIELLETEKGLFFDAGSAKPSASGQEMIAMLARELGKLPNPIVIEGHTDAKPFSSDNGYGNWELSADRANSSRRLMQHNGLRPAQVVQIRGFADQHLLKPDAPLDPANRRVSVIVKYESVDKQAF